MSKKSSGTKKLARDAKAVSRQSKKATKNVAANLKQTGKLIRAITGSKTKPKSKATKEKTPKKAAAKKQTKRDTTSVPPPPKPKRSTSKKHTPAQPGASSYRLTDLASGKNLGQLFSNLEENVDKIDALKPEGARWAFKIYDRQSLAVYRSMRQVLGHIGYLSNVEQLKKPAIDKISFLTIGGTPKEYQNKRKGERMELDKRNAETISEVRRTVGGSTEGRSKTKNELLHDLLERNKQADKEKRAANAAAKKAAKRAAETETRLQKLEKQLQKLLAAKPKKATKKRETKKSTTKKRATKKQTANNKQSKTKGVTKSARPTGKKNASKKRGNK